MILLDTNVLSTFMSPTPHPSVVEWVDAQQALTLYISAISVAEVRYGIAALPEGRRRTGLDAHFEKGVLPLFEGRILVFDEPASAAYGLLRASMRSRGRAIGNFDALIAATALSRQFAVSTRDVQPFHDAGLHVINPFDA